MTFVIKKTYYMPVLLTLIFSITGLQGCSEKKMFKTENLKNSALLLIDIQNDYFPGGNMVMEGSNRSSLAAKELLKYFRDNGLPLVHIQHFNSDGAGFFLPGTEGAGIHQNVAPLDGEKVIIKHVPDSFIETGLEDFLKAKDIKQLFIVGMQTNVCVISTASHANELKYKTFVVKEAVSAVNETISKTTLDIIEKNNIAKIISIKDLTPAAN